VAQSGFFSVTGVKYTVTAQDGTTTAEYTVKATRTPYSGKDIEMFFVGADGWTVSGTNITKEYPSGTDPATSLTPTITLSTGATVSPASGVAQSGFFSAAGVKYTVTAEDGTTKEYTVKANIALSSSKDILSFTVGGTEWTIDGLNISYTYPAGTNPATQTVPVIKLSDRATVNPASEVAQDFFTEAGVTYTVTAEDGSTQTYIAKATVIVKYKYDMTDWVVLPRNKWHVWGGDGEGYIVQEGHELVWAGGHPMLVIDEHPGTGWHCFAFGDAPLPQVLIVDMKESHQVSEVIATGVHCNSIELYVTDDIAINGYETHTVSWDDWKDNRETAYEAWVNLYTTMIPGDVPAAWGSKTDAVATSLDPTGVIRFATSTYKRFSFDLNGTKEGRFLVIRFTDSLSLDGPYVAAFSLEVYE
jgi:hypothetical protein